MVWIHGGGFVSGSSQELPSYDGENLARAGVVLISVNHRLGPLGFLDLSAIAGSDYAESCNASFQDLVLALQWVRDNVAVFGGDPSRITLFGQSGGGAKVSALMAMPAAVGLFHRAIVMSGSFNHFATREDSQRVAAATLQELGIPQTDLQALRDAPAARLIDAGNAAIARLNGGNTRLFDLGRPIRLPRQGWGPVIDGKLLPQDSWQASAPAISQHIPLIVGTTREEFRDPATLGIDYRQLQERLQPALGERTPQVLEAFRQAFPAASAGELAGIIGGMTWRQDAVRQAELKAQLGGAPVYNYWFTWQTKMLEGRPGAFHCSDLAFCFDNTARCDQATGDTEEARELATSMSGAWTEYAATGRPGQAHLAWTPFDVHTRKTMVFDSPTRMQSDPAGDARRALTGREG